MRSKDRGPLSTSRALSKRPSLITSGERVSPLLTLQAFNPALFSLTKFFTTWLIDYRHSCFLLHKKDLEGWDSIQFGHYDSPRLIFFLFFNINKSMRAHSRGLLPGVWPLTDPCDWHSDLLDHGADWKPFIWLLEYHRHTTVDWEMGRLRENPKKDLLPCSMVPPKQANRALGTQ